MEAKERDFVGRIPKASGDKLFSWFGVRVADMTKEELVETIYAVAAEWQKEIKRANDAEDVQIDTLRKCVEARLYAPVHIRSYQEGPGGALEEIRE